MTVRVEAAAELLVMVALLPETRVRPATVWLKPLRSKTEVPAEATSTIAPAMPALVALVVARPLFAPSKVVPCIAKK